MNIWPLIITFFVIGSAELGDKTQLLTFGLATKYPIWKVILAVFCATGILMAAAVVFGGVINYYFPTFYVQLFAGLLFIFFGFWTIWGREEKEEEKEVKGNANPFWVVFAGFLLAELGDKTQLATFVLSAKYGTPFQIWLGATLGMAGVNSISALAGGWVRKLIPEAFIKFVGAAVFIIFGLLTLGDLFVW